MYTVINGKGDGKLILCIKADVLKRENKVQKDVKLEELMNTCIYCNENEVPSGYVPLTFGITIRDNHSNEVLNVEKENEVRRTFIYLASVSPIVHEGYDLVMFLSSVGVMHVTRENVTRIMMSNCMVKSVFDVSGLVWLEHNEEPNCLLFHPMIMSTIYVDKNALTPLLNDEWKFSPISELKAKGGYIKCIMDDLVEADFSKCEEDNK